MAIKKRNIDAAIAAAFSVRDFCRLVPSCRECPFAKGTACLVGYPTIEWDLDRFEKETE